MIKILLQLEKLLYCKKYFFASHIIVMSYIFLISCNDSNSQPAFQSLVKKNDDLYDNYFIEDDLNNQKDILLKIINDINSYANDSGKRFLVYESNTKKMTYLRLSLIEQKLGNSSASKIDFIKARYWRVISSEHTKDTPQEVLQSYDNFKYEQSLLFIEKFDKRIKKAHYNN